MFKNKKWLVVILTMVILGTVAVGAATASTQTTSSQGPYQTFLGNLSNTLGISQSTLTSDLRQAYTETVNQEVYNGKITQQQADRMLARVSNGQPMFGFMGMGRHGRRNHGAMGSFLVIKPLAGALGMNPRDLMSALRSGQTIAALAAAKGTTVAGLQSTILSSIQSQLTSAVQSGKMTQTQETQIYDKLQQNISSGNWVTQLQNIRQTKHWHSDGQQSTNA